MSKQQQQQQQREQQRNRAPTHSGRNGRPGREAGLRRNSKGDAGQTPHETADDCEFDVCLEQQGIDQQASITNWAFSQAEEITGNVAEPRPHSRIRNKRVLCRSRTGGTRVQTGRRNSSHQQHREHNPLSDAVASQDSESLDFRQLDGFYPSSVGSHSPRFRKNRATVAAATRFNKGKMSSTSRQEARGQKTKTVEDGTTDAGFLAPKKKRRTQKPTVPSASAAKDGPLSRGLIALNSLVEERELHENGDSPNAYKRDSETEMEEDNTAAAMLTSVLSFVFPFMEDKDRFALASTNKCNWKGVQVCSEKVLTKIRNDHKVSSIWEARIRRRLKIRNKQNFPSSLGKLWAAKQTHLRTVAWNKRYEDEESDDNRTRDDVTSGAHSLAVSPSGQRIAIGNFFGEIEIWSSWKKARENVWLHGPYITSGSVKGVILVNDHLLVSCSSERICVWAETNSGLWEQSFEYAPDGPQTIVAWCFDGREVLFFEQFTGIGYPYVVSSVQSLHLFKDFAIETKFTISHEDNALFDRETAQRRELFVIEKKKSFCSPSTAETICMISVLND